MSLLLTLRCVAVVSAHQSSEDPHCSPLGAGGRVRTQHAQEAMQALRCQAVRLLPPTVQLNQ